eukprot:gene7613-15593_t
MKVKKPAKKRLMKKRNPDRKDNQVDYKQTVIPLGMLLQDDWTISSVAMREQKTRKVLALNKTNARKKGLHDNSNNFWSSSSSLLSFSNTNNTTMHI